MGSRTIILFLMCFLLGKSAWSKVFVRWSEATVPLKTLGVTELVIPWESASDRLIRSASGYHYRVYLEIPLPQASRAAELFAKGPIVGLIVDPANAQQAEIDRALHNLRSAHPKLTLRLLNPNGKQPQMRGQTVDNRNGILQVSSPTAQPWLDSNLALARFEQEFHPEQAPLYAFPWEAVDSLQQENGPSAEDYSLAVAEAGAIHADLILNLHAKLQKGLVDNQAVAWATWNEIKRHLSFASNESETLFRPWANVGVMTDNYDAAYEPMNLMGRHNIPFRVLRAAGFNAQDLEGLDVVTVFTAPDKQAMAAIAAFAHQGGTAILVNLKGTYPWQSAQPVQTAEHALSYAVGKGRVIELAELVSDPETFAQDVRRLINNEKILISLWNALTTIAVPYRDRRTGELMVDLVNYAVEPLRIQVQVKGSFQSIRYETPEGGCCQALIPESHDGFTDFVVPSLRIGGRVRLKPVHNVGECQPSH